MTVDWCCSWNDNFRMELKWDDRQSSRGWSMVYLQHKDDRRYRDISSFCTITMWNILSLWQRRSLAHLLICQVRRFDKIFTLLLPPCWSVCALLEVCFRTVTAVVLKYCQGCHSYWKIWNLDKSENSKMIGELSGRKQKVRKMWDFSY